MKMVFNRKNKFNARKCVVDGHKFDSIAEAKYYCQLMLRKKIGEITDIELQVDFLLIPTHKRNGKTIRATKYKADFVVTYADGHKEVIDVKGFRTKEYQLKKKMLLYMYPEINFLEVDAK